MSKSSRTLLPTLAAALALLLAACASSGGGGGVPAPVAPDFIAGSGHYDLTVLNNATPPPILSGTWAATYALTRSGDVYSGSLDSTDNNQDRYVELTATGDTITSVYTRQPNTSPGQGLELSTSNVVASTVTDAPECPGVDALQLTILGSYTSNGAPTTLTVAPVVWTICDSAAASYFG